MSGVATAIVGSAVIGGVVQGRASNNATNAQNKSTKSGIREQRAARESAAARLQPFADIGLEAGEQLQNLLANPNQGLEEINPIVSFLRKQGFEDIQESAAAGGRLGAGGTLKDLTQFNSDLTSTVVPQLQNQRFNQLFNVAGMGQNAAAGQATGSLQTGNNISNLLGQQGQAQAQGAINSANTITNALNTGASAFGAYSARQPSAGGTHTQVGPPRETAPAQSF